MATFFWVMFGGALGTGARFALSGFAAHRWGETFPWGTILINVTGSFVISFFAGLTGPEGRWFVNPTGRQFFIVGICGGYTTFSSYSYQTLTLAREGQWFLAAANVIGSNVACLVAVWLGFYVASLINAPRT
jgi:CrcB protein